MSTINTGGIAQNGILIEDFEDASDWTNFGSSAADFALTDDTSTFLEGTQSLKFSATGTGTVRYNRYRAEGFDLSGVDTFTIWTDWDQIDPLNNVTIYMSSDGAASFANSVLITMFGAATGTLRKDGGKYALSWRKSDMSVVGGTIDWSGVTNINILCNMAQGAETINFDALYCGKRTKPKVVVCMDDGVNDGDFSQVDRAGDALSRGVPISFFVIPSLIDADDGSNYVTIAELITLQAAGHLVAGHSNAGSDGDYSLGGYTPAEVTTDINTQRTWLADNGFSGGRNYFAWPGGAYFMTGNHAGSSGSATLEVPTANWTTNQFVGETVFNQTDSSSGTVTANTDTQITATLSGGTDDDWDAADSFRIGDINFIAAAQNAGITAARSITGVVQTNNAVEKLQNQLIESIIINSAACDINSGATSLAAMIANVDQAIEEGTTVFFYVHKISLAGATPSGYEITGTDWNTFCTAIQAKVNGGLIDAITMDDWFNSLPASFGGGLALTFPLTFDLTG